MRIIYGTDGSECAGVAGRLLAALPLPAETEVTVLSAVRESSWVATLPLEGEIGASGCIYDRLAEIAAEEGAAARQTAEAAAGPLRERGLRVEVCVRHQRPAAAILEQARAEAADLVVVGSHGKGMMKSFLLGSVSERVARYAPCSVLVARGEPLRRAVVGQDGSESAAGALALLEALTPQPPPLTTGGGGVEAGWSPAILPPGGFEVRVVHVLRPCEAPPGVDKASDAAEWERLAAGDRVIQAALERLRAAGRAARCAAARREPGCWRR